VRKGSGHFAILSPNVNAPSRHPFKGSTPPKFLVRVGKRWTTLKKDHSIPGETTKEGKSKYREGEMAFYWFWVGTTPPPFEREGKRDVSGGF